MAKTVGTLAYAIVADTRKFTEGIVATKNELRAARDIFNATQTPAERLGDAIAGLDALMAKGAIDANTYRRAMDQLNDEFAITAELVDEKLSSPFMKAGTAGMDAASGIKASFMGLVPVFNPIELAVKSIESAYRTIAAAASYASNKIAEQYDILSDMINAAENLGIAAGSFQVLAGAANLADIEAGSLKSSLESMLTAISKGDTKKMAVAFEKLGLDFRELKQLSPDEALRQILMQLDGIANQADRVRVAKQIFGDADILRLHADTLDEIRSILEETGALIDNPAEIESLAEREAAWKKLQATLSAIWANVATELAPALTESADAAAQLVLELGKAEETKSTIDNLSSSLQGLAAVMKDAGVSGGTMVKAVTSAADVLSKLSPTLGSSNQLGKLAGIGFGTFSPRGDFERQLDLSEKLDKKLADINATREQSAAQQEEIDMWNAADAAWELAAAEEEIAAQQEEIEVNAAYEFMTEQLKEMREETKAWNDDLKESEKAIESLKTPAEKAADEIAGYIDLFEKGFLTEDQLDALKKRAVGGIKTADNRNLSYVNPAMEEGSQAAIKFIQDAKLRGKATRDYEAEQAALLARIEEHLRGGPIELTTVASL